jgi:hypothetical protein
MPVACVIGWDPIMPFLAGSPIPTGVCEWDVMGAYRGEPAELVRCETVDLEVPAAAEIVLEGYAQPGDERIEGPFGEFHGYYPGKAAAAPAVRIERVYFRNDPIIVGSPPAKPPNDYSYSKAVMRSALLFDALVGPPAYPRSKPSGRTRSAARACSPSSPSRSATLATRARPATSSISAAPAPTCRATPSSWTTTSIRRTCRK